MKNKFKFAFSFILAVIITLPLLSLADYSERKIIVFKSDLNDSVKETVLIKAGANKIKHLKTAKGSVAFLSKAQEKDLLAGNEVLRIDDDVVVSVLASVQSSTQVLPWGINRVDAELVWPTGNNADPIKIGVIDTGISNKHPDLLANVKGGINTINSTKNWNDDNGHGSHVAGIVGALNNSIGVIGVGPLVDLYAIKVLSASGSGFLSDVIEGIEWSIANGMQVVNMSLGTSSNIQSFHDAVIAAKNAGLVVVAAAGNSGGAVSFPAAYPEAIAVSATDSNNQVPFWSSRGLEVDLAAPGVSIFSTYRGNKYATLSGTSMAAPHVAGSAALVLNTLVSATYDLNLNNKWDSDEVQKKLQDTAVDFGNAGFDNLYGWGLVNAYSAAQ